ncbi:MAG: glycoside hydrolase family 9 protein [Rikenellaceae bacterium]
MRKKLFLSCALVASSLMLHAQDFQITSKGYFKNKGVDVMAYDDIYPDGHQGGISLIMNGNRIASNGDIRLEPTPGQWQPTPKQLSREVSENNIKATLCFPDSSLHLTGFNPKLYPNLVFHYDVNVRSVDGAIEVTVDLDRPIPEEYIGQVGFNFEFFPGSLFGKPWIMDDKSGIYPQQANVPLDFKNSSYDNLGDFHNPEKPLADVELMKDEPFSPFLSDEIIALPYAVGRKFTSCPNDPYNKVTIESFTGDLELIDGRVNHTNGWFVLRSAIAAGATKGAVRWVITPNIVEDWMYEPVVQASQVGYHTAQHKEVVVELDARDTNFKNIKIVKFDADGETVVKDIEPTQWGSFLRYTYLKADFSDITEEGLYQIKYGESQSSVFRIASDVYQRGVWQPVLEYFLPVQMCHMRVNDRYRVWHDVCHMDDAQMAPACDHIDGYSQEEGLSKFKPFEQVEGVNIGGWHDAGDFDLRVESQSGECYIMTLAQEAFNTQLDVTSIDYEKLVTEIHLPDGKNDMLQQIENGALTVVNGYLALGRLYRGIICRSLRQYVLLGDAAAMTDGVKGNDDDRWIFTENNPKRELQTAANMAATARALEGFNDTLSVHSLVIAEALFEKVDATTAGVQKVHAATELLLTTGSTKYSDYLIDNVDFIVANIKDCGWFVARAERKIAEMKGAKAKKFSKKFLAALPALSESIMKQAAATPYGIPYNPGIWGAGWGIQEFGFEQFFLVDSYPEIFSDAPVYDALNFVLGCHPGSNTISFASGVGAQSAIVGYGLNRADWSYIPGGVISGTALIRPDFPELMTFPYIWQQTEYVMGGGSSHYMFLVLASDYLLNNK